MSRIPFSNARRGKLESVVDTDLLVDPVVAEDFDKARDREEFDDFPVRLAIFSKDFKFFSVRQACFGGLSAPSFCFLVCSSMY